MAESPTCSALQLDIQWIKSRLEAGDTFMERWGKIMDGNGCLGIIAKVNIMWTVQFWLIGLAGSAVGSLVTAGIFKWMYR